VDALIASLVRQSSDLGTAGVPRISVARTATDATVYVVRDGSAACGLRCRGEIESLGAGIVEISRLEDVGRFSSMQGGPLARLYACRSRLRAHNLSDIEI
jgi:hypothetical protein